MATAGAGAATALPLLALYGRPTLWQAAAFAFFALHLAALLLVERTGKLAVGEFAAAVCTVGAGFCLAAGGGPAYATALGFVALAPVETALAGLYGPTLFAASAAAASVAAIALGAAFGGWGDASALWGVATLACAAGATVYACALALAGARLQKLRRDLHRVNAQRYVGLTRALGDVVAVFDAEGRVLSANEGARGAFGLDPVALAGRGLFDRVHVGDRPAFLACVADATRSADPVAATFRVRKDADGGRPEIAWLEMRALRCATDGDGVVVAALRDVTASREREAALDAARAEAELANAWKDRFLANVSHELRTPLAAIIGFAEMLADPRVAPTDPAKARDYARTIQSSGEHLLGIVNTILDMSKIEAGGYELEPEPVDLVELAGACAGMLRLKAEAGGVALECAPPSGPVVADVDRRACRQVVINLLSNAVKFTPAGGAVTLKVRARGAGAEIVVADTGIGIAAADLPRIGEAFFQSRATYDRPYEGTGLGLSVVRGLVALHGGAVAIESAPGHGTSVVVRLPAEARAPRTPPADARFETLARPPVASPKPARADDPAQRE
ncbi:MAG: PAS domain-containing sensor histidine kinase, partial [Hyphomicrobiales bacterium]|nr:PAS domain-containing sensor histidine kinase [Hyphomicrobiales bacterium]